MEKIIKAPDFLKDEYREKLGSFLDCDLTKFKNEIFYILKNTNKDEIGLRRIVFDFDEKYFDEYLISSYKGKKIGFFTGVYIDENFRNNGYGSKMFHFALEKFKFLKQDYVFSDARDSSLNIFLKKGFEIIGEKVSKEGYKEKIVIKKI